MNAGENMGGSFVTRSAEPSAARGNSVVVYAGLVTVCLGALGWALHDRHTRSHELGEIRQSLAALEQGRTLDAEAQPRPIYVTREVAAGRSPGKEAAEPNAEAESADEEPESAGRGEERDEPTPEQRLAAARGRFQHIQGIFESQTAADYDPVRTGRLESSVKPALETLKEKAKDLKLGQLECKGRMCGLDVAFKSSSDGGLLYNTLTRSTMEMGDSMPLVHLVMLPADQDGQHTGRAYFEWHPTK